MYRSMPETLHLVAEVERTGVGPPLGPSSFLGYSHRPMQLSSEVRAAGLSVVSLVGIEGAASLLADLEERAASTEDWSVVLDTARATESVPNSSALAHTYSPSAAGAMTDVNPPNRGHALLPT